MKKSIFLFLVSTFSFLGCPPCRVSPVLALDPIIIEDTRHYYPNTSNDDQNYIPSDPNSVETISIEKSINISQSFNPIVESQIGDSPPVYQHQDINDIQEKIDSQELNTNFYRQNYFHFSQPLINPLAESDLIKSTFTSYNSAHNATRRSLPASVQRCYISQQISDISTFIDGGNSVCIDREIDTSRGKIRIGEIISALIKNGLGELYYSDPLCPPQQLAKEFPSKVLSALKSKYPDSYTYSLSLAEYQQLYLYGIEPICTNSLAQSVSHCNLDSNGNKRDCQETIRSQPLAAATANDNLYRNYLPQSSKNLSKDYANTEMTPAEVDRPNAIGWLAQFFKNFFSGRLNENKSFSGPHSVTTKIDVRQSEGLEAHETAIKNFIPDSSNNFDDTAASGTNGVTLDPGESNAELEDVFFNLTRPASWK